MYNQDQRLQAWIVVLTPSQVATGAAEMYSDEVQQIHNLSHHGTQQLLADLEYFCNVLAALGVALPVGLSTWQVITHHVLFWVPGQPAVTLGFFFKLTQRAVLFSSLSIWVTCVEALMVLSWQITGVASQCAFWGRDARLADHLPSLQILCVGQRAIVEC